MVPFGSESFRGISIRSKGTKCRIRTTSRFNALRHGVLSVHTVLPWESGAEYEALLNALVEEYAPHGPTEEHLVEEIAGVIWRKRRLRLAEAASHRRGIEKATAPLSDTLDTALNQVERALPLEPIIDAVSATLSKTAKDLAEVKRRNASLRVALEILSVGKSGAYEAALAELDERTRTSGKNNSPQNPKKRMMKIRMKIRSHTQRTRPDWRNTLSAAFCPNVRSS